MWGSICNIHKNRTKAKSDKRGYKFGARNEGIEAAHMKKPGYLRVVVAGRSHHQIMIMAFYVSDPR